MHYISGAYVIGKEMSQRESSGKPKRRVPILSEEARVQRRMDPSWQGSPYIEGTDNYSEEETPTRTALRQDIERRENFRLEQDEQKQRDAEEQRRQWRSSPAGMSHVDQRVREMEEREKRTKQCAPEAEKEARMLVYEAFLGVNNSWSDNNKAYHTIMKKLDYNRSRMNQEQDKALNGSLSTTKYIELAERDLLKYWTQLRAIRSKFSMRDHTREAKLNEWRQQALAASQVLGTNLIELQNSMPTFASENAREIHDRFGIFKPYVDENIATG